MCSSLPEYLTKIYGDEAAAGITTIFNAVNLPVPGPEQFFRTSDNGALVFMKPTATTIRIVHDDQWPQIESARILRPLWTRKSGDLHFSIYPGGKLEKALRVRPDRKHVLNQKLTIPVQFANMDIYDVKNPSQPDTSGWIKWIMRQEGIDGDIHCRNTVLLPGFPFDYRVIADTDRLQAPNQGISLIGYLMRAFNGDPQKKLFGPLKKKFDDAWPQHNDDPDTQKFKEALLMCKDYKQQGKLVAGWEDGYSFEYKYYDDITSSYVAHLYAKSLEHAF